MTWPPKPVGWDGGDWSAPPSQPGSLLARTFSASRLPFPGGSVPLGLPDAARRRRSSRRISSDTLDDDARQNLLASLCAVDGVPPYPSAGALYPCHPFLLEPREGHGKVLYLDGDARQLREVRSVADSQILDVLFEKWAWPVSALLIGVIDFRRVVQVYGERGSRFALLESGMMMQKWLQVADSLGLSSCVVGGYADDAVLDLLGLDPDLFGIAFSIATGHERR